MLQIAETDNFLFKYFADKKKRSIFALAIFGTPPDGGCGLRDGPFVYRLGRKIFILERGVRFPYGLPQKKHKKYQ